jgi:hypothetical protein
MTTTTERPAKPRRMNPIPTAIPAELHDQRRWVVWRWAWKTRKYDKPPLQVDGTNAKSDDPSTWYTLAEVLAVVDDFDGVGFMLRDSDYVGVDLDDCRDPSTGGIREPHASVIHTLESYAEVSPSGKGVKLLARAKLPPKCPHANHADGFEVYDKQYFTLTGHRVPGTPATINDRQSQVAWVVKTFVDKRHQDNERGNLDGVSFDQQDDKETAQSALGFIPNSGTGLGYEDWIRVGMALHSVDTELFSEWDRWSQQSSKYVESECRRKWSSFNGQGDVTIGTLVYMAKQHGWKPPTTTKQTTGKTTSKEEHPCSAVIANCAVVLGDDGKPTTAPLSMSSIIATANEVTGNWPRRVADALFVHAVNDVAFLKTEAALFGFYHSLAEVHWTKGARYVTKAELFAEMQRNAVGVELPIQLVIGVGTCLHVGSEIRIVHLHTGVAGVSGGK